MLVPMLTFGLLTVVACAGQTNSSPKDYVYIWGIAFQRTAPPSEVVKLLTAKSITVRETDGTQYLLQGDKLIGEAVFAKDRVCEAVQYWDTSESPEVISFTRHLLDAVFSATDRAKSEAVQTGTRRTPQSTAQWATLKIGEKQVLISDVDTFVNGKPYHAVKVSEYAITLSQCIASLQEPLK
ncbi:MAG: hypothetical protein LAQ30_18860 [Acidobacteriia bacterium]|nr:hypothetical protein [Terriglobia bacterium]